MWMTGLWAETLSPMIYKDWELPSEPWSTATRNLFGTGTEPNNRGSVSAWAATSFEEP